MALREFTDDHGVEWKAWDVEPEGMHPVTAAEDFLADMLSGWLCFESKVGRRRLAPFPYGWSELPTADLRKLLDRATPVVPRTSAAGKDLSHGSHGRE